MPGRSTLVFVFLLVFAIALVHDLDAREPEKSPPNLLKNSDFSRGTEYWEMDGGEIILDPNNPTRKILRLPLPHEVGAISQKLSLPPGPLSLDFKCRLRGVSASKSHPILVRVRIYDEKDNSLIIAEEKIVENKTWHTLMVRHVRPREPFRNRLLLETITGQGPLLIANVTLHRSG